MAAGYQLPTPPPAPGMSRGTKVLLWSVGGCGVVLLLAVVGSVIFGAIVASRTIDFHLGSTAPADFPVYPGAREQTGVSVGAKNGSGTTVSLVQWSAGARADIVLNWYKQHLDEGDWALDDETLGRIHFHRRSTGATAEVQVRGQVTQTLVQLVTTGDQSLDPGASPASGDGNPLSPSP